MDVDIKIKKNIWILNHYATGMYFDKGGRHYYFAKYLKKNGYRPFIFCANTIHNSDKVIQVGTAGYVVKTTDDNIPFIFIKTSRYKGNGFSRIKNMFLYAFNMYIKRKEYALSYGIPNIIYASSVHPLTLITGIFLAKYFGIKCICEVRDLWPETLVAYGRVKSDSILGEILYAGERWIYRHADSLIFTMEGGRQYIIDKKWDVDSGGDIQLTKVYHINNGVDLSEYEINMKNYIIDDEDLDDDAFKVIYTGAISKANNLGFLVGVANILTEKKITNIKIIIYGDGLERANLEKECKARGLTNIVFKGTVPKKFIPYILSKANVELMHWNNQSLLLKYGVSLNKSFEYLASGKPIICDLKPGYDYIQKNGAGIVLDKYDENDLARTIINMANLSKDKYEKFCLNAYKTAQRYDFNKLTGELINIIENS